MKEIYGKKNSSMYWVKSASRLNIELKHYGLELYESFADLTV